jgi:hypothetical protein
VALAPVVIGFFEFTFMRVRDDAPMEELAQLFDEYLFADDEHRFARAVFEGSVQVGRAMVREEALPPEPPTEVLAFERATPSSPTRPPSRCHSAPAAPTPGCSAGPATPRCAPASASTARPRP